MKKFLHRFSLSLFFYVLLTIPQIAGQAPYVLSFSPAVAASNAGSLYFIHQDHLGSVIAVSNEEGNLVSETKYSPYGDAPSGASLYSVGDDLPVVPQNGQTGRSVPTERGYTGQIVDQNTALQYYNARYYDPVLSRFVSADSVEGGNRFAYVNGNPVMASDPSGNKSLESINSEDKPSWPEEFRVATGGMEYRNEYIMMGDRLQYPAPDYQYRCGPASLSIALSKNDKFEQLYPRDIAVQMQEKDWGEFVEGKGSTFPDLVNYAASLGIDTKYFAGKNESLETFMGRLKEYNEPVIVGVNFEFKTQREAKGGNILGHFVVVIGWEQRGDQTFFAVVDPNQGHPRTFDRRVAYGTEGNLPIVYVPADRMEENLKDYNFSQLFILPKADLPKQK